MSVEHTSTLAHHFDTLEQQRNAALFGMWAFLLTEVMLFAAVLTGYAVYRAAYPAEFAEASRQLSVLVGGCNTAILLGSSLTMAFAVRAAQCGHSRSTVLFLLLTVLLGLVFLGFKAFEYWTEFQHELVPGWNFTANHGDRASRWKQAELNPNHVQLFFVLYFVLTGLHAVHMLIGMGVLIVLAVRTSAGRYSSRYYTPIELGGLYWHFVDIVWIYLFPLLYLIGTREAL